MAVDIDRTRAQYVGITTRDITNSLVVNLAGSGQIAPTYWLNPANGVTYNIVLQTPQYRLDSLASLSNLPIAAPAASSMQVLGGIADLRRDTASAVVSQYDLQNTVQVYAAVQDRDLGAVAADVRRIIDELSSQASPKIRAVKLQGQVRTMNNAFAGLLFGLLGAIVLIYLLIVVNFQSWSDPFIIITALPVALAGIVWMLFATNTTLSVPALTGAIMCMGVATANSVLVISFARERLAETGDLVAAALEAGFVRFRPVIMTALAMIIGMAPMALGLGAASKIALPVRSVPRKVASSASMIVCMCGASRCSSGYCSPSASMAAADSSCMKRSSSPRGPPDPPRCAPASSRRLRTLRRRIRRST